jgi:hypothetical protein
MKRRHASSSTTSLDLLLDTICNMFGGVLLMAILVVVLTQSQAAHVRQEQVPEAVDQAIESRQLRMDLVQLESDVVSLKQELRQTELNYTSEVPAQTRQLVDRKTSFEQAMEKATHRLKQTTAHQRKVLQELSDLSKKESELSVEIESREQKLGLAQGRLRRLVQSVKRNVRLPHQKGKASGLPTYYLIKGDRMYRQGRMWRWRGQEFVTGECIGKPVPNSNPPAVLLRPRPGAGSKITKESVLGSLRNTSPKSHYVVMWVYDDSESFRSFQQMKKYVLDSGYRYVSGPKTNPGKGVRLVPARHHKSE